MDKTRVHCPYAIDNRAGCRWPACCTGDDPALDAACLDYNGGHGDLILNLLGGARINLRNPQPEQIRIEHIANALSNICRFAGHVPHFYSVAQHSMIVATRVSAHHARQALLHDASEAYLNDITRMVKHSPELAGYRRLEAIVEPAVLRKFGLPEVLADEVKLVDRMVTEVEFRTMLRGETGQMDFTTEDGRHHGLDSIEPWDSARSEREFMELFQILWEDPHYAPRC